MEMHRAGFRLAGPDALEYGDKDVTGSESLSSERIRELLNELNEELRATGDIDAETLELLSRLNDDLDEIAAGSSATAGSRADELESRFAAQHPVAARIVREIADVLAKMGI